MRIGLFSDTYLPDINGVVTSIANLKKALEGLGHQVYVITNHPKLTKTKFENDILYLPGVELKFLYGYTLSTPIQRQAAHWVETMELDVIHIHSEFGVGFFGRIVANRLKIPMVTTYHTQYEDYTHYVNLFKSKTFEEVSKKAVALLSRIYSKNVQVIIAPSHKTKEMLLDYDIRKEIVVIPSGLDLKRFENQDKERNSALRNKYQLKDKFIINYTGRVAQEKRIDLVIDGFSKLIKICDTCHLMIVGDGPVLSNLKTQVDKLGISDFVTFVGSVNQEEIVPYYQMSDVFVSASLTETQGLTFIEALANGLCVFARYDEPLKDIIIENKTGYFFEDTQQFVDKMITYIESDASVKAMHRKEALEVVKEFNLDTFGTRALAVYQKAIDQYYGRFEIIDFINLEDEQSVMIVKNREFEDIYILDDNLIERKGLKLNMELSRNELHGLDDEQQHHKALNLAYKRLARRDYSSHEMRDYLSNKVDLTSDQMDDVLEILISQHLIDDNRYLQDRVDYHHDQLRGNGWIQTDLKKRGFSDDVIDPYLDELYDEHYLERALNRAERFVSSLNQGSKMQRKNKLKQHLMRQGFESSIIKAVEKDLNDDYSDKEEYASLEKDFMKAYHRYLRKDDPKLAKEKAIRYAMGRGYHYELVKEVLKEIENEEN